MAQSPSAAALHPFTQAARGAFSRASEAAFFPAALMQLLSCCYSHGLAPANPNSVITVVLNGRDCHRSLLPSPLFLDHHCSSWLTSGQATSAHRQLNSQAACGTF